VSLSSKVLIDSQILARKPVWLSRCPSHTWTHIKYPSSLCVCTRVYKHTYAHHSNTRKNREIYKTNPLSLPLPKHSLPRQQQALTINNLEKTPLPIPLHTRMQVLRNTCDTRACSREIGQYKYSKSAYTSAYVHPYARVHKCICMYIHRHT